MRFATSAVGADASAHIGSAHSPPSHSVLTLTPATSAAAGHGKFIALEFALKERLNDLVEIPGNERNHFDPVGGNRLVQWARNRAAYKHADSQTCQS